MNYHRWMGKREMNIVWFMFPLVYSDEKKDWRMKEWITYMFGLQSMSSPTALSKRPNPTTHLTWSTHLTHLTSPSNPPSLASWLHPSSPLDPSSSSLILPSPPPLSASDSVCQHPTERHGTITFWPRNDTYSLEQHFKPWFSCGHYFVSWPYLGYEVSL